MCNVVNDSYPEYRHNKRLPSRIFDTCAGRVILDKAHSTYYVSRVRLATWESAVFQKSSQGETDDSLLRFIRNAGYKRPTLLQSKVVPLSVQGKDILVETGNADGKTGAYLISLLMQYEESDEPETRSLIITYSETQLQKISRQYKRLSSKMANKPTFASIGGEENIKKELRVLRRTPTIIAGTASRIIDHLRRGNLSLENATTAVVDVPDDIHERGFDQDVRFIYSKMTTKPQVMAFTAHVDDVSFFDSLLRRPIQLNKSDWESAENTQLQTEEVAVSDNDEVTGKIQEIIRHIKEVENPDILNYYKKLFKKNVPLHLRSYVAAYLLKEYLAREGVDAGGKQTLFVSIGKNRKVFPKDLSKLFSQALHIDPSLIGSIKILDNYSFIEVPQNQAEKAIEFLNDTEFRGRKITVNYARKKADK